MAGRVGEVVEVELRGLASRAREHDEAALLSAQQRELAWDQLGVAGGLEDHVGDAPAGGVRHGVAQRLALRVHAGDAGGQERDAGVDQVDAEHGPRSAQPAVAHRQLAEQAETEDDDGVPQATWPRRTPFMTVAASVTKGMWSTGTTAPRSG